MDGCFVKRIYPVLIFSLLHFTDVFPQGSHANDEHANVPQGAQPTLKRKFCCEGEAR